MKRRIKTVTGILVILGVCLVYGCIQQNMFRPPVREITEHCVTPLREISLHVAPDGISTTSDGSLFAVTTGSTFLYNSKGELLWTKKGIGGSYTLLTSNGTSLLAESYKYEEPWKSTIIKLDSEGNTLWERQTGLIGLDGLAVTSDGSFIAVGATDEEKKGHLMLFDGDGTKLWDHQIDGRIETVAVSKNGYVVAGPRDMYIYVYDQDGQLVFKYFTMSAYSEQDTVISPDETFFLFGSQHKFLNCYALHGELLWQKEVGTLSDIRISEDSEYIAIGTHSELFLFDRNGNELWKKEVSNTFIHEVAISAHAEYIAVDTLRGFYTNARYYTEVYSREGDFLWRYQNIEPFMAIAMSSDGHYIAAGSKIILVFFDNFKAIEEYSLSECAQQDNSSFLVI